MKKKALTITALVLAVALIGGIWWYTNQPVPTEEPEDDTIPVNTETEPDAPEANEETDGEESEESEGEQEGDGVGTYDGTLIYNEETGEFEPAYGVGNEAEESGEMTDEEAQRLLEEAEKALEEGMQQLEDAATNGTGGTGQGTGNGNGQTGGNGGGGQSGGSMTLEEALKQLQDAGINATEEQKDGGTGSGTTGGATINW